MLFPYCAGMLLARIFTSRTADNGGCRLPGWVKRNAFIICAVLLIVLLPVPFVGSEAHLWQNGIDVTFLIIIVFPAIVWTAAAGSGSINSQRMEKFARFLGDISYPLYAIHYPVMYLFYAYIGFPDVKTTMAEQWPVALGVAAFNIALAYIVLKFYDRPVRRRLAERFINCK